VGGEGCGANFGKLNPIAAERPRCRVWSSTLGVRVIVCLKFVVICCGLGV
jgi:hypothetical protein